MTDDISGGKPNDAQITESIQADAALFERFPGLDGIEDQDFDTQIASYSEVLRSLEQELQQHRS